MASISGRVATTFNVLLTIFLGIDCKTFYRRPPLHPECWSGQALFETCCIPPKGRPMCFPDSEQKLSYEYCCELPELDKIDELTAGGWLDTRFLRAGIYPITDIKEGTSTKDLIKIASVPHVEKWFEGLTDILAQPDPSCQYAFAFIQRTADNLRNHMLRILESAFELQGTVHSVFHRTGSFLETVFSTSYHALIEPMISGHRFCMNTIEFLSTLMLTRRECFFPALRELIGRLIASAKDLSEEYMKLHFSISYMSSFGLRPESTKVKDQFEPLWLFYDKLAEVGSRCLDIVLLANGSRQEVVTFNGFSRPASSYGGFSEMGVLARRIHNSWQLDHGLVASLIRLWPKQENGYRLSIADFGAGGGHYCDFFNKTEQYDCFAFDGAERINEHSDGRVSNMRLDLPFDLGRKFDWVMSLEVAEHLSPEASDVFVSNLRRHTSIGLVLSWSGGFHDEVHPNAMGWNQVRTYLHEHGFAWDKEASSSLAPVLSWMRGNVNVYRPV